jgi:hypothetical protein
MKKEPIIGIRGIIFLVIIFGLAVLFVLCGCEEGDRTPTRMACEIKGGTDGIRHGWFQYTDYLGQPIEEAGLRMEKTGGEEGTGHYTMPNGVGGIQYVSHVVGGYVDDSGVTDASGRLRCWGLRSENWYHWLYVARYYQKPGVSGCECSAQFCVRIDGENAPAPYYSAAQVCTTIPDWVTMYREQWSNLTEEEQQAILEEVNGTLMATSQSSLPDSGFTYSTALVQQVGRISAHEVKLKSSVMPGNVTDPDMLFVGAYPYMYSFIVRTAGPADFEGKVFEATVISDTCPKGVPVDIKMVAHNEEKTVHIMRTSFFKPIQADLYDPNMTEVPIYDWWTPEEGVDPNDPETYTGGPLDIYDPNFITDEMYDPDRVVVCQLIPVAQENDAIRIKFELTASNIMQYMDCWLTNDKNTDINGDGIVNFMDMIANY